MLINDAVMPEEYYKKIFDLYLTNLDIWVPFTLSARPTDIVNLPIVDWEIPSLSDILKGYFKEISGCISKVSNNIFLEYSCSAHPLYLCDKSRT